MLLKYAFLAFIVLSVLHGQGTLAQEENNVSIPPAGEVVRTFHGFTCTEDCSGHKAGYNWAARKGLTSEDECGGRSNSFIEGCRAYVREQAEQR